MWNAVRDGWNRPDPHDEKEKQVSLNTTREGDRGEMREGGALKRSRIHTRSGQKPSLGRRIHFLFEKGASRLSNSDGIKV